MTAPLILTLMLAPGDQARFEALRRAHFPSEHNVISAHVTLFHHLPGLDREAIEHVLGLAAGLHAPFEVEVRGLRSLGRGVAFELHSAELSKLRAGLASAWHDALTAQDRQGFRPHVTIQNKVTPEAARSLLAQMQAVFSPFGIGATGLSLWRYLGGPWEAVAAYPFQSS